MPVSRASHATSPQTTELPTGETGPSVRPAATRPRSPGAGPSSLPGGASPLREALPSRRASPAPATTAMPSWSGYAVGDDAMAHDELSQIFAQSRSCASAYGGTSDSAPWNELSLVVAQAPALAGSARPSENAVGQPTAPTDRSTPAMRPWSPYDGGGDNMAQNDLHSALAQFMPPAGIATARPPLPSPGQDSIASGSQSGGQLTEAEPIKADLINWGNSVASRKTPIAQAIRDIHSKYGVSKATAQTWFTSSSGDGLSARGKRFLEPSKRFRSNDHNLSEAQFHQLRDAYRRGASVEKALFSIGRNDIIRNTAEKWFANFTEDCLSARGRSVLKKICEREKKAKGGPD